jgi:predicted ATPase/DNA-binding winged helix-turn-helix (wHTH) protein
MNPMNPASDALASVAFGPFRVLPHRRELLADDRLVKLGGRAFDVLMALIEARGTVLGKGALMARLWPNRIVEEKNLHVQISALRTALGAERELIRTVSGRGYQFTGEPRVLPASPDERAGAELAATQPRSALPPAKLPQPVSELIGRDDELCEILGLAAAHRLVTLTGAGGIGKTRLALTVAHRLLPQFADGVWVVELAPLADPALVPAAVAAALGLEFPASAVSAEHVANALSGKELLLVLDNCEHVIDAAARMAEALLRANPVVHVIATSREPLKAEAEWIHPVPPLAVPAAEREDPWRYGAVWLFVVRSRASGAHISEDRHVAAMIAAICRRLDGIPLAIELAAARVVALGIEALAARLDDRFQLLTGGRRTALPRHQTLRATLDWSYELLAEPQRVILRRLAVFAGACSLEAAGAVVASPELASSEVVAGLVDLVAKSLIVMEIDDTVARYRLLDTTRAYALEKLGESGECERLARRHVEYYRDLFERAEAEWEVRPTAEWLADYGRQIDNLRAALDWAFSPAGDASVAVALTVAAVPLWTHLSLLDECRGRLELALVALGAATNRDARCEMKLLAALGASLIVIKGTAPPELVASFTRALEIAEGLEDAEFQARSLWGLWVFHQYSEQYRAALAVAERFRTLAARASDPSYRLLGERLIGVSQHFRGDQTGARRHLEVFLAHCVTPDHRSIIRFSVDQQVTARVYLARILWLQGFPDQAVRTVDSGIEDARVANHANTLCGCLAHAACQIALWVGDQSAAEYYVTMLLEHSIRHALAIWRAWGLGHQGVLSVRRGDVFTGLQLLRSGLDELGGARSSVRFLGLLGQLAEALGRAGEIADGLATIDEAIERCERTEEHWVMAELLRIKGELLLLQGAQGTAVAAEDHFRQALDWARRQGALSWELRAATSLARLLRDQGCSVDALALLQPVYDRFSEGFGTADLQAAKALLDVLAEPAALGARLSIHTPLYRSRRPAAA